MSLAQEGSNGRAAQSGAVAERPVGLRPAKGVKFDSVQASTVANQNFRIDPASDVAHLDERRPKASAQARTGVWPTYAKRGVELVLALILSAVLVPALIVVWALVRLNSAGPGLYWSKRVGVNGKLFWMPKFRTMIHGAPEIPRENLPAGAALDTSLANMLRKTSVDELPQLLCIIKGDMSFVGPRPLLPTDPGITARKAFPASRTVRPGLTGLAQIRGRNFVTPRRKGRFDALYARKVTLGLDLFILWNTVTIVLKRRDIL